MAGFDFTGPASNLIKRIYDSKDTVSQLIDSAPYIKSIKKTPADLGDALYASIQIGRNQSLGIRNSGSNDNQALPRVSNPSFDNPNWNTVRKYARIYVTGKAVNRTSVKQRSFFAGIGKLVADTNKSHWREQEFAAFNGSTASGNKTGCRGVLDDTAYVPGSQTFTLDVATSSTHRRYQRCIGLFPNMTLDVYDKATWVKVATITVSTVNKAANTFVGVLDNGLAGTADKWYLFREGDFNQDVAGLLDIVDDGTLTTALGGLTTAGLWSGNVLDNSGTLRDLTVELLNTCDLISQEQNDENPGDAWMNFQMYQKLLELHQRTIVLNKGVGSGMFKANLGGQIEDFGQAKIRKSSLVPSNTIFVVQTPDIEMIEQEPYSPMVFGQEAGKDVFWRFVPGYDAWEAVFVHEWQQKISRRNLHVQLGDVTQASWS